MIKVMCETSVDGSSARRTLVTTADTRRDLVKASTLASGPVGDALLYLSKAGQDEIEFKSNTPDFRKMVRRYYIIEETPFNISVEHSDSAGGRSDGVLVSAKNMDSARLQMTEDPTAYSSMVFRMFMDNGVKDMTVEHTDGMVTRYYREDA